MTLRPISNSRKHSTSVIENISSFINAFFFISITQKTLNVKEEPNDISLRLPPDGSRELIPLEVYIDKLWNVGSFVCNPIQEKDNDPKDLECQYDQFPVADEDILVFCEHRHIPRSRQ